MPRTRPRYANEFRQPILELARAGRSADELAKEFERTAQTIRNWIRQAELDQGQRQDGLTSDEKTELSRLRKENKQLRLEREILSHRPDAPAGKAADWFAQESETVPPKSSTS